MQLLPIRYSVVFAQVKQVLSRGEYDATKTAPVVPVLVCLFELTSTFDDLIIPNYRPRTYSNGYGTVFHPPPPPPPPPPAGSKTPIIKMTIKRLHILCLALPYHHHHRGRKRKSRRRRKKKAKPKPLPKFLISMVRVGSSISNQLNRINEKRKGKKPPPPPSRC